MSADPAKKRGGPFADLFRLPHQGSRSSELDFVRGIAILLVMGHHFHTVHTNVWLFNALEYPGRRFGGSGVDIFFVLSGFLVGGLLLKEYKQTGSLDVRRFIFRRGLKIWPAYYFFLIAEIVGHAHPIKTFLWQNAFHLQNYVGTTILGTWTLSLEEHFYLLLALSMGWMVNRKWAPEKILKVFVVVMIVVFCVRCLTVYMGWPGALEYTHNRLDSLLCGVCLATIFHFFPERFQALTKRVAPLVLVSALLVAFLIYATQHTQILFSFGFTLVYLGSAGFLLLVYSHSAKIKNFFLYRMIAAIGVYSYAIYLWHSSVRDPSLHLAMHFPAKVQWPVLMLLQYGLAILVGVVTTQLVEWPFLRIRNAVFPQKVADISGPQQDAAAIPIDAPAAATA